MELLLTSIRPCHKKDAIKVGLLIADTYTKYNLGSINADEIKQYLGPFAYANSQEDVHQQSIANVIKAEIVILAEINGNIVGVLRGRPGKLQSLFVSGNFHRQGVGRMLVQNFENACQVKRCKIIKVQATLYAVPFYLAMGYKRSTGVRRMTSFQGENLPYQPMKKIL